MKAKSVYYLKKHHSPLITSKKENEKAVIDIIDGEIVYGHYVLDPKTTFACMRSEFSKIFSSKQSLKTM